MHSETDLAYLAGLFDGEGHLSIVARTGPWSGHQIRMGVHNTNIPVLEQIAQQFNGTLRVTKKSPRWRDIGVVAWSANKAVTTLRLIQPYLRMKSEQCKVALRFAATLRKPNAKARALTKEEWDYREVLRLEMHELNKRSDSKEAHSVPAPVIVRGAMICKHCGQPFQGLRKRMYCSNRCRIAAGVAERRTHNIKACTLCGKEFPAMPKQVYCSGTCAQKAIWSESRRQ